jgi:hypothetical protein
MPQFVLAKNHLILCHAILREIINIKDDMRRRLVGVPLTPEQHKAIYIYLDLLEFPSKDWQTKDAWLVATISSYFLAMMNEHYDAFIKCLDELAWRMKLEWQRDIMTKEQYLNIRRTNHETKNIVEGLKNHENYKMDINPDTMDIILSTNNVYVDRSVNQEREEVCSNLC